MQNQQREKSIWEPKYLLMCLMCLFLAGCSSPKIVSASQPTVISKTQLSVNSPTPEIPTLVPTSTALAPTIQPSTETVLPGVQGLVVLSLGDGFYSHLFVYGPDSVPLTRLTDNSWDDQDPALSPDGTKIAYSSNQGGQWDIYILDLQTTAVQRMTKTKTYDGAPSWSPDGQYLIYQTLDGDNLDLMIQSVNDPTQSLIQLTAKSGDNFDPAWSPDGHTIAFISNRNGQSEIWLADLQSNDRFKVFLSTEQTQYRYPRWSADGTTLAWCKQDPESTVEFLNLSSKDETPTQVGAGCNPVWAADGSSIMATLDQENASYLVAYRVKEQTLSLSPLKIPAQIESLDWISTQNSSVLAKYISALAFPTPKPFFSATLSLPESTTGRQGVVKLDDVTAPQPYLADSANEAFNALRLGIGQKSGWDFLASLENAYLPLTGAGSPALTQNWSYTGRAIDVNTVPIDAGWMAVSREDINGQTFWRVWIKCLMQDGSCGKPMLTTAWNFSSRFDSDPVAYENGGNLSSIPSGYWIDFTEFANRYGWDRQPSQADWRYYYPGILFNRFIYSENLNWYQAMLELYPANAIQALITGK
jgi:TolB protein